MTRSTMLNAKTGTLVGMGETILVRRDETARAVVGSCVGLVLYAPRCRLAAVAHIMLPEAVDRTGTPGKFADTAIPHLLALLEEAGAARDELIAKIAGGAQMFGGQAGTQPDGESAPGIPAPQVSAGVGGRMQIGEANVDAVTTILAELAIPILGTSVGGTRGRKFSFCCASGEMAIEIAGQAPFIL